MLSSSENEKASSNLAIYLHIPYCRKICPYCDFNVYALKNVPQEAYVQALLCELQAHINAGLLEQRSISTIYFGGGTPSTLSGKSFQIILTEFYKKLSIANDIEITIEANPLDVTQELFQGLKELGINRVSLGGQSTLESKLKKLGRDHRSADIYKSIEILRRLDFDNINLDLMFATPDENLGDLTKDLENYCQLQPEHISPYGLTIEQGTPFYKAEKQGLLNLPAEELAANMFELIRSALPQAGLQHYEISNFAKVGKESKHNLACWNFEDYLGLGAGAHSCINSFYSDESLKSRKRWANIANHLTYCQKAQSAIAWTEDLNPIAAEKEYLLSNLRKVIGIDLLDYTRIFQKDFVKSYDAALSWLIEKNLLRLADGFVAFTPQGQLLADSVLKEIIAGEVND